MKFIKKFSVGGYIMAAAVLLTIVSLILACVSNSYTGYEMSNMAGTVLLSLGAILAGVGAIVLSYLFGNKWFIGLLEIAMVVMLSFIIWTMVYGKMDVFGTVLLSDLEKGFPPAEAACSTGITTIVLYLVSGVITLAATFFNVCKENA